MPHTIDPYGGTNGHPGVGPGVTPTTGLRIHYTVNNTNHTYDAVIYVYNNSAFVQPTNGSPPYFVDFKPGETAADYINALCSGLGATSLNPTGAAFRAPAPAPRQATAASTGAKAIAGSEEIAAVLLANGSLVSLWITGAGFDAAVIGAGQTTTEYRSSPTPEDIIAGDFNGDGIADLAVSNYGSLTDNSGGNIQIFLGKGDGTFAPGTTVSLANPTSLFAADFNGDGKLDLVASNVNQSTISVMLGNGDGTFQPPQAIPVVADASACSIEGACFPSSIVAADFNGDGKIDLAVGLYNAGSVAVLLGKGNGTFQQPVSYAVASGHLTYLATADINGDNKLDLIAASPDNDAIAVLAGNGDGTFAAPNLYVTGSHPAYFGVCLATDGVVILTSDFITGDLVATPINITDGSSAPALYAVPQTPTGIAAGDLNGDGLPDMVVADGGVSVLLRNPKAQFNAAVNYTLQSGSQAAQTVVGDFNRDGKNDVAAAGTLTDSFGNLTGAIDVLLGNGDGSLGKQASYALGGTPSGIVAADFNGDGNPDVAAAYQPAPNGGTTGGISVLLGNGDGTLQSAVNYPASNGQSTLSIVAGDFNGDGKLDLAAGTGGANPGPVTIWFGKGDGTFTAGPATQAGSPAGNPVALAAADFNGDGKLDLAASVVSNGSDSVVILLGNGDGTLRQMTPVATGAAGQAIAVTDLNGDGKPDVIIGDCCGVSEGVYLLGNGDGSLQPAVAFSSGASVAGLAPAAWNADGIAGMAVAQRNGTVMAFESGLNPKFSGAPQISSIENAAGGAPAIAPNTWIEIDGTALAPAGDSRPWQAADFVGGVLPAQLDGVEVTVNGLAAYVYYISPTQIDVLTPPNTLPSDSTQVSVVNNGSVSAAFNAEAQAVSPSFFVYGGTSYIAATHANGSLIGPSTLYPGASTPAKPGETIALYGNGFGPTSQAVAAGSETQGGTLSTLPVVTIGGVAAKVTFAGLVVPGEFQINVTVPSLPDGDQPVDASYNSASTQNGVLITVHQ